MENSSLNKAHQQQRRAEALLFQRKFEECVEAHKKTIELLDDACKLTTNEVSLESLRLQKIYNQKQIDMVKIRKAQLELHKQAVEAHKQLQQKKSVEKKFDEISSSMEENNMEAAIYRTMEIHDSLLCYLGRRGNCSDNESYSTSDTEDKVDGLVNVMNFMKHPKDDATIIEELKLLSDQLRDSVQKLLIQLDERNRIIDKLNKRIAQLESEKATKSNNSNSLKVTDSSGGTSPYIFSPCSELSPSPEVPDIRCLPPLAPLEMPNFDFTSLMKNTNNN